MDENSITLSVLMPARNAEKTIGKAIRSTLFAMPPKSELLIFLDACIDSTEKVISEIRDPRIKILGSGENIGVAAGLNVLLDASRGKYIARMDSDDICLPWRFQFQLSKIRKSNADIVFSNAILFGRQIKPICFVPQLPFTIPAERASRALVFGNPFVHPSMLATRKSLMGLNGYRKCPAEDYDLWMRAVLGGIKILRTCGYGIAYRVHPHQLTQQSSWRAMQASDALTTATHRELIERVFPTLAKKELNTDELRLHVWKDLGRFDVLRKLELIRLIGFRRFFRNGISGER